MHLPINVKSPNNISKWQMGFNSAFKALISFLNNVKSSEYIKVALHYRNFKYNTFYTTAGKQQADIIK
jgi:hypothetical protein